MWLGSCWGSYKSDDDIDVGPGTCRKFSLLGPLHACVGLAPDLPGGDVAGGGTLQVTGRALIQALLGR